jgi:very-short-patch-repair endonuclease
MRARQADLLPAFALTSPEAPAQSPRAADGPEDVFASQCRALRLPTFEQQHVFAKSIGRRWRFDFAWPAYWLAVELDGVNVRRIGRELVVTGRHASIDGIRGDHEKINTAILLGWSVLRFLQTDVKPKLAIETTMRVLAARGWKP